MSQPQSPTLSSAERFMSTAAQRVRALQARYLADTPRARAVMAELRRSFGKEPGTNPGIWEVTQPESTTPARCDAPTWEENALHTTLTLYAIHQQSRTAPMHAAGVGLGRAADAFIGYGENERLSARARFNALVTAATYPELVRHLRGFISLLRAEDIPMDYGMLARDLLDFQRPGGAATVRRRWARQMYFRPVQEQHRQDASAISSDAAVPGSPASTN